MHCHSQLNYVNLLANNVLKHMQMEHGLCIPRLLSIQPSNNVNFLICPACPKSETNSIGWNDMKKHFTMMHTKLYTEIKFICHDCGTESVRLKDLCKHKICNRNDSISSISKNTSILTSKQNTKEKISESEKTQVPSFDFSPALLAASLQESVPCFKIDRQNSSIICSSSSSKQGNLLLSSLAGTPISPIHKRWPTYQNSPISPAHKSLPISSINKTSPMSSYSIDSAPALLVTDGEGLSTNTTIDDVLRKNVVFQSDHLKKRRFEDLSEKLNEGRKRSRIKEAINERSEDPAAVSQCDEEAFLSRELHRSSGSETEEGEIKDDFVGFDEATDEVITSSNNLLI